MRRILRFIAICGFLFSFLLLPKIALAEGEQTTTFPYQKMFVVSGYYSPLPGQAQYVTGTYEGDIRLNGDGVHAADGTVVYPGMIAAPREYPFGTKMTIPGIGTAEVHDRGGAIKNNRIDVWMGSGEEGMRRALAWGMREVLVTVLGPDSGAAVSVDINSLPLARNSSLYVRTQYFLFDMTVGDQNGAVSELQRTLKKLGFFPQPISGLYGDETKQAVYDFQEAFGIVSSQSSLGAGYAGPQTRAKVESELAKQKSQTITDDPVSDLQKTLKALGFSVAVTNVFDEQTKDALFAFQRQNGIVLSRDDPGAGVFGPRTTEHLTHAWQKYWTPDVTKLDIPERHPLDEFLSANIFKKDLAKGDQGGDVTRLQEELEKLNFFWAEPTGFYGSVTEHAVYKFQQSMGIVATQSDTGAGAFGPKTRDAVHSLISRREEQNRLIASKTDGKALVAAVTSKDVQKLALATPVPQNSPYAGLFATDLAYGESKEEVQSLQKLLKNLGYFQGSITTNYFGDVTRDSITQFQLKYGIISSEEDKNAGSFDDATKEKLKQLVSSVG